LVLDTGANRSAVTAGLVQSLGSTVRRTSPVMVHGVTGSAVVPAIHVSEMEFGELQVKSSILPIVPDVFGGAEGVLGKEGFEDKRIFIDFAHDRLIISRSHKERAPAGFATVPVKIQRDGLLIAEVRIGGVKAKAVIDTGGQQTCGNLALRDALLRHARRHPENNVIIGVTLDRQSGQTIPIPPINFGPVEIQNMSVMLGDINMFKQWKLTDEPALLIGMDVLGSVDTLVIDYKMKELQVRLRRGFSLPSSNAAYSIRTGP
jgi:predicted aspartyl protease